jgi:hypothetical protein
MAPHTVIYLCDISGVVNLVLGEEVEAVSKTKWRPEVELNDMCRYTKEKGQMLSVIVS